MRKRVAMLLALMFLIGTAVVMNTSKVHALNTTSIVATTDKTSYSVGDTVKVTITGQNMLDLNGVGFTLKYDTSLLNLQGNGIVLSPTYETFGGAIVDTTNGVLTYALLNKAPVQVTKTEVIGQINFNVLKSGIGTLQLSGITAIDGNLSQVQASTQAQTAFSASAQQPPTTPTTPTTPSTPTSTPATTSEPTSTQLVSQNDLPAATKGTIALQIQDGKHTVKLPSRLADLVGVNSLQLIGKDFTIEFSNEALKNIEATFTGKQADGAQISFSATVASKDVATNLTNHHVINSSVRVDPASAVYNFNVHVVATDGTQVPVTTLKEPLMLSFKVNPSANWDLLGVYEIASDGTIRYVGGTFVQGMITVQITELSQYAVLEFNKTFSDVASSFWANDVIKKMAAKHLIDGVTDTNFNPEGNVTRAQFAAMLARTMGLKAAGSASFKDVNPGAWYAEVVAQVSEAGIVLGRSSDTFAPDEPITREEMAVMSMRAYEHLKGKQVTVTNTASFHDHAQIQAWAQNAVSAAQSVGLIQGRSTNQFAPQALMTRAESAQVISNLLSKYQNL
ncbi:S-layer homology domain-containing protein [Paenibacillus qinlingensis]|uniref:S-layer homology domain-containing protein n=1 Tax=Paenibacillus qinlingensis TaxID=1837343 RepID=UPI001563DA21|nr:S-layer homology domain-containing protein [Paenibacillus qinlingensis]NQX60025.1 S-layer homology domain-containing protein [Paenibacillus qinlingensis]